MHIHEVVTGTMREGASVKLLGMLTELDAIAHVARIELEDHSIQVNTNLLAGIPLTVGKLYHFIGELEPTQTMGNEDKVRLNSRVVCDASGLDVELWKRALEVRRTFLSEEPSR
jgi:hypothetical protein